MRKAAVLLLAALASCGGPKSLTLPDDPIGRAATCGVVAAAAARLASANVQAPLPLEARGRIVAYALLAATESGGFDAPTVGAVSRRMNAAQAEVTGGKWQDLQSACAAAYPDASREAALPDSRQESELGCSALAEFMADALQGDPIDYGAAVTRYRQLRAKLSDRIGPILRARAGASLAAQRAASDKALAAAARLGPPIAVLDLCAKRFGG
jgi:hypothetical protein